MGKNASLEKSQPRREHSFFGVVYYTGKDAYVQAPLPVSPADLRGAQVATGVVVGVIYAAINLYLMMWWGYGGFAAAFPALSSTVVQLICYYAIAMFLVQVVLATATPLARFWAMVGFLSPWALLILMVLPQFSQAPGESLLILAVPVFGLLLNGAVELARE
ncbi:hypothetical protein [Hydrogenophaga sp.]|uniref:hypothetical protein n=1 Tax=Hydrogenophaga sp. TaxID=1904254 RepID=UPI002FCA782F